MKKIIISVFALTVYTTHATNNTYGLLSVPTYTQVNQINKGLFGYKEVYTTTDTHGNQVTVCQNGGFQKCRTGASTIANSGLGDNQIEEIERLIMNSVTESNPSGSLVYNALYLVQYNCDLNTKSLQYTIYTKDEAASYGFGF